jgi:hypothetical protein
MASMSRSPEAVDRHECYMRSPYPGRIKVRPECHYQQHRKAADALDDPTERFQARWIGPMGVLEDHQHRSLACQFSNLCCLGFQRSLPALFRGKRSG